MNGRAIVHTLKQVYADGTPTGLTKVNDISDPDYIPPFYTDTCAIPNTTTTTTTSTTAPPRLQYSLINSSAFRLYYELIDTIIIRAGSIYPGQTYTTQFTSDNQTLNIKLPIGDYSIHKGSDFEVLNVPSNDYINIANSTDVQDFIDEHGSNTINIDDKIDLVWEADPSSLTCEQVDTTTTTTTSTSSTTTTSTTTPFNPLRYINHIIGDGSVNMTGTLSILGNVNEVVTSIYSGSVVSPVNLVVNSTISNPIIDGFWLIGSITNPTGDGYNMEVDLDGVLVQIVSLPAGDIVSVRIPVSGAMSGSQVDVFFSIGDIILEWEADPDTIECELVWDGTGTTSTTTTTTNSPVEIDTLVSNITVPGPYVTPPVYNAVATLTLVAPAPYDLTFVIRQNYNDSVVGIGTLEFEITVLSGDTSGSTNFNTGHGGSLPPFNSNTLSGVPCVLGYRSASPITLDYNSLGCKVTSNYAQLVSSGKFTRITLKSFNTTSVLIDRLDFPPTVDTIERVIIATGYFTIDVDNTGEATMTIVDVFLDGVFFDYYTVAAGATSTIRVPGSGTQAAHNIKIQLT